MTHEDSSQRNDDQQFSHYLHSKNKPLFPWPIFSAVREGSISPISATGPTSDDQKQNCYNGLRESVR